MLSVTGTVATFGREQVSFTVDRRGVRAAADIRVHVEDLTYAYGRNRRAVLSGLNLTLHAGDVALISGKNGTGKTTFLRVLTGRLRPQRGSVQAMGSVAFLPTRLEYHDRLTVLEEIRYLSRAGALEEAKLLESLAAWGLDIADLGEVRELSAGQRQRLGIAIVGAWEPDIILLDEPTANLDARGQKQLHEWVGATADRGGCVVIATHDDDFLVNAGLGNHGCSSKPTVASKSTS